MLNKIRLKKIKIVGFKNILSSEIELEKTEHKSVTGIYGSNGSGKTAVIDTIDILKDLLSGDKVNVPFYYVNVLSDTMKLNYSFEYNFNDDRKVEFNYTVEFTNKEGVCHFSKEKLTCKSDNAIINYIKIDRLSQSVTKGISINQKKFSESKLDFEKTVKYYSMSIADSSSLIFGKLYECLNDAKEKNWLSDIINHFNFYSRFQMFVIKMKESSKISANDEILFHISIEDDNSVTVGNQYCNLLSINPIPKDFIKAFEAGIEQCNKLLTVIIPDFKIDVNVNEGEILDSNGRMCKNVSFSSIRMGKSIPLVYESDGIKKLISIVSSLISCYNNVSTLVAIDELDASVYEYLLGQIIQVMTSAKGQLVFTSHNLRVLEVIDCNNIVFSTLNPNNRFIKFSNCKPSNNLRNLYLRALQIGGQKEEFYKPMDNVDLKIAFKHANKS